MLTYEEVLSWLLQNQANIKVIDDRKRPVVKLGEKPMAVQVSATIDGQQMIADCPIERNYEPHQALMRAIVACVYLFVQEKSKLIIVPSSAMLN